MAAKSRFSLLMRGHPLSDDQVDEPLSDQIVYAKHAGGKSMFPLFVFPDI